MDIDIICNKKFYEWNFKINYEGDDCMIISRDTVELPEKIPEGIKHLRLENNFEKYIDNLPNGLITLTCGRYFNLPLNNLPNTLKLLVVCGIFNQPLDFLPNSLIYLQIGNAFRHSLSNLPNSLKYLKLQLELSFNILVQALTSLTSTNF